MCRKRRIRHAQGKLLLPVRLAKSILRDLRERLSAPAAPNNPVPQAACAPDFASFGITQSPPTFGSDTVNSFEVGAKNNIDNRVKIASSIYYIRWNNIQQSVLPPTCQITFIANLGTAVAKGGDIQADIALTDNFTAEIATGYTSARYTQDSRFSDLQALPIVSKGDAIVGQSGEPPGQTRRSFHLHTGIGIQVSTCSICPRSCALTMNTRAATSGPPRLKTPTRCNSTRRFTRCRRPIWLRRAPE